MITFAMSDEKKPVQHVGKNETPRPLPAPNSPFGSAPKMPAKPEYDQRSLWPSETEGSRR